MRLTIVDRARVLDDSVKELIRRRLLFALSRFEARIQHVSVAVEDVNGPRGGVDKACRIAVRLQPGGDILVTDESRDVRVCVSRAADRIGRAVRREIEKRQRNGRPRAAVSEFPPMVQNPTPPSG